MIIAFPDNYTCSPSAGPEQTRIYELERALQHILVSLIGAHNSLDMPRDCISPMAARVQVDTAIRLIHTVL